MSKEEVPKGLWRENPDECCEILKVKPTREAVKDLDAWICGLRATEGRTRIDYKEVEIKNGLVKINPILIWTELDVWRYFAFYSIPVHPWYKEGYRSLGCEPCTEIVDENDDESDEDDIPYNVAYIKLDEGPLLITNIVGCANDDIYVDMPVEVVYEDISDEVTLPKFRPVK